MEITTTLAVLQSAIDTAKRIKNVELQASLLDLKEALNNLREENIALKEENLTLKTRANTKAIAIKRGNAYYDEAGGPYCMHCYESDGILISYPESNGRTWNCLKCKSYIPKTI